MLIPAFQYTFLFFIVDVDITFSSASPTSSAKSLTTWQRWQAVRSAGLGRNGRSRRDTHAVRCAGDGFTFDNRNGIHILYNTQALMV